MFEITIQHLLGMLITLFLITMVGIYSGKKVKTSSDFSVGDKKAGAAIISGTIMGTLVGGASTVGTAQLAFLYGFSAWWFTLGAGIGCLILSLVFSGPLYKSNKDTVPQILTEEFGSKAGPISSIFVSLGTYLNIIAQILSAVTLLTSMFNISALTSAFIAVSLMAAYVIFGGVWGTGYVGLAKLTLLYTSVIVGGFLALKYGGGVPGYVKVFPAQPYFNLFSRGLLVDGAAGFSLILGVLSTQTYIQAILSGRTLRESKLGSLISAVLIPPIGLCGIIIGLYMKMSYPNISPASAFPQFVLSSMNPWFGGVVLATLLVTVIGTGAGLSLGISTVFTKDIYKNYINKAANDEKLLKITRKTIIITLLSAVVFITGNIKSLILKWSFMSMGLRGAAVFTPLCAALFMKGKVNSDFAIASMALGPIFVLAGKLLLPEKFDPLFLGLFISLLVIVMGRFAPRSSKETNQKTCQ